MNKIISVIKLLFLVSSHTELLFSFKENTHKFYRCMFNHICFGQVKAGYCKRDLSKGALGEVMTEVLAQGNVRREATGDVRAR